MPAIDTSDPSRFINAYSSTTGKKTRIPAAWLDHKVLSRGFRKTPLQKAAETKKAATPQPDPAPATGDNKEGK